MQARRCQQWKQRNAIRRKTTLDEDTVRKYDELDKFAQAAILKAADDTHEQELELREVLECCPRLVVAWWVALWPLRPWPHFLVCLAALGAELQALLSRAAVELRGSMGRLLRLHARLWAAGAFLVLLAVASALRVGSLRRCRSGVVGVRPPAWAVAEPIAAQP